MLTSLAGYSIPNFVVGVVLLLTFGPGPGGTQRALVTRCKL
jgi:hypothetical protein